MLVGVDMGDTTVNAARLSHDPHAWLLLQALSASAPLIALWDDHEFTNNVSILISRTSLAPAQSTFPMQCNTLCWES